VVFTFLVNLLFTPGAPLFGWSPPWGGLSVPGVLQGLLRAAQLLLMLSLVVLALSASTPLELVEGVEALFAGIPALRKRARDLATPMLIAFRFLPVLLDEADEIRKAQRMRGALRGSGLRDRIRGAFAILTPVFLAALRRGEGLALALEARGYGVAVTPPPIASRPLAARDALALLLALAALALSIGLRLPR
jgi:energy-coupling factor transport system permease protein